MALDGAASARLNQSVFNYREAWVNENTHRTPAASPVVRRIPSILFRYGFKYAYERQNPKRANSPLWRKDFRAREALH